ncbi:MAG: hypothetical protein AB7I18_07965 [Candidatus Berkiella sp.]
MPANKGLPTTPVHPTKVLIDNFYNLCSINLTRDEWNLETFLPSVKAMSTEVFNEFINTYKLFSNNNEAYVADYPRLLETFSTIFKLDLHPAKSKTTLDLTDYFNQLKQGIYRAKLWFTILTEVLPEVSLSRSTKAKKEKEIVDELFEHLPGVCAIAINCFTSSSVGVDYYGTVQELLPALRRATPLFIERASIDEFVQKSERLLEALAKAHEFCVIMQENEDTQTFSGLYTLVYNKSKELTGNKQRAALRQRLDAINHEHTQTLLTLENNPWASLFKFYHIESINPANPDEKIDIHVEAPAILALLEDESQKAQVQFIDRLKTVLNYQRAVNEEDLTPEIIQQYITLLQSIQDKCLERQLPKESFMRAGIQALLKESQKEIEDDSPICEELLGCHYILSGSQPDDITASLPEFQSQCENVKANYENYANSNPAHYHNSEHLALILELKNIFTVYKSLPSESLQPATATLFATVLFIMKKGPSRLYQPLADELKTILLSLRQQQSAKVNTLSTAAEPNQVVTPVLTRSPTPDSDVTPVLTRSPTPESDVTPLLAVTPQLSTSSTPELEQNTSPIASRSPTPVPMDIPPVPVEVHQNANDDELDPLAEQLQQIQISKTNQIQLLAEQFREVRVSQSKEQEQANRLKLEAEKAKLEDRFKQLKLKQERKLAAQQKKHEKELEKEMQRLKAQHAKTVAKLAKRHAKAIAAQEENFKAQMLALSTELKKEELQQLDTLKSAQEAELKKQDEDNYLRLVEYRANIESSTGMTDMKVAHEANMARLQESFESAKEKIPSRVQARVAEQQSRAYAAYRESLLNQLQTFRFKAEVECQKQFQSQLIAMHEEMQKAQQMMWNEAKNRYEVVEQVALPKPLVDFMHQFKPNTPNLIALDGYYNTLRKLFINPDYLRQFNFIFNYGFLSSLIPTLPERYSLVLSQRHPAMLQFWRNELVFANQAQRLDAHIVAAFLLLPIEEISQVGTFSEHIQYCIDSFVSCFYSSIPADMIAFKKAIEATLHDQSANSLYNRYQAFKQQYVAGLSLQEKPQEPERRYLPQYAQRQTREPSAASPSSAYRDKPAVKPQ